MEGVSEGISWSLVWTFVLVFHAHLFLQSFHCNLQFFTKISPVFFFLFFFSFFFFLFAFFRKQLGCLMEVFTLIACPRRLQGKFSPRDLILFLFPLLSNPLTTSWRFSISEPIWGASEEVFTVDFYFSLIFIFFSFFFSTLPYLKNKIIFKCKNTCNGAMCTSRLVTKWCGGLKCMLWQLSGFQRPTDLTLKGSNIAEEKSTTVT